MPHTTLIQADELRAHREDPDWVVLDCRFDLAEPAAGAAAFLQGHLPGAQYAFASLVKLADYARERGVRIIAITDSPLTPFKADVRLSAPVESASFISFHCAPLILINTLLEMLSRADEKATLKALRDFESLAERAGYFHAG